MFKIIKNVKNNIKTLKEVIILFFFYVLLIFIIITAILIMFTNIKIHIENLKFTSKKNNGRNLNSNYKITLRLYLFRKINYLKILFLIRIFFL